MLSPKNVPLSYCSVMDSGGFGIPPSENFKLVRVIVCGSSFFFCILLVQICLIWCTNKCSRNGLRTEQTLPLVCVLVSSQAFQPVGAPHWCRFLHSTDIAVPCSCSLCSMFAFVLCSSIFTSVSAHWCAPLVPVSSLYRHCCTLQLYSMLQH